MNHLIPSYKEHHDIFSDNQTQLHEQEDGNFDYGCCGDNLPMPSFDDKRDNSFNLCLMKHDGSISDAEGLVGNKQSLKQPENRKESVQDFIKSYIDTMPMDQIIEFTTPSTSWVYLLVILGISISS